MPSSLTAEPHSFEPPAVYINNTEVVCNKPQIWKSYMKVYYSNKMLTTLIEQSVLMPNFDDCNWDSYTNVQHVHNTQHIYT